MKENTLELSFEMYEELKETLIKTLRTELAEARSQSAAPVDTDAIKQLLQAISDRQEQIRKDLGAQISEEGRESGRDGDSRGVAAADGAAPFLALS